jgi:hypothetical protein
MPHGSNSGVAHGKWRQYGRVKALCRDDHCPWKHVADNRATVNRKAVEHVRATGHAVDVERTMWKIVEPAPAGAPAGAE